MCRSGRPRRECGSCWRGVHGNRGVAESRRQAGWRRPPRRSLVFWVVLKQSVTELLCTKCRVVTVLQKRINGHLFLGADHDSVCLPRAFDHDSSRPGLFA
eukprot:scaffold30154_cov65-Phaeocystis_antarctica.AAC.2